MLGWRASWVLIATILSAPAARLCADSFGAPRPRIFSSESGTYGFKVLEPKLGESSRGVLFTLAPDGQETVIWTSKLVNLPGRVFVSEDGNRVVTVGTLGTSGHEHSVTVYTNEGKVLTDYKLEDILTEEELRFISQSTSTRAWTVHASFRFDSIVTPKQYLLTVKRFELLSAALQRLNEVPSKLRIDDPKERERVLKENEKRIEEVQTALKGPTERVVRIDLRTGKILAE